VRKPKKRKYLYRRFDYIYFRHPKTQKLTPMPRDETSKEFTSLYNALIGALENEQDDRAKVNSLFGSLNS